MAKDIVGKLHNHLAKPITSEPDVMYLLAETRKLLARDDPKHTKGALWMYCHWALHVDLDSPKTTMNFLKRVDRWVTNTVAYLTPSGPWKFLEEHDLFKDFIYLNTLRSQLAEFLTGYGLPTTICHIDEQWFAFLEAYAGLIENGTLATETDKQNELGAVKKVTFSKGKELTSEHHVPFIIQWDIELKDGRTLKTTVNTVPSGAGKMTFHHLEVIQGTFVPPPSPPQS
jgi:hypothetical protein